MKNRCVVVNRFTNEILVRIPEMLKMYEKVYDSSGKKIGKVVRILGPVAEPYGVVKLDAPSMRDVEEVYTR
ncbi:hypothetical protein IX51_06710 [uncultured archaeon]|nr:hypothetical protein IX51_06710 [uncultured archaeon]HKJ97015.1 H/ACA RNA-protein complex protein Gar1 [Thermoplasmataceae archaeon]